MYTLRAGLGNGTTLIGNYPTFGGSDPAVPLICAGAPMTPGCPGAPDVSTDGSTPPATGPATTPAIYNLCLAAPMTPGCPGAPVAGTAASCPAGYYSWLGNCYRASMPTPGTSQSFTDWFNANATNVALIGGGLIFTLVLIKAVK